MAEKIVITGLGAVTPVGIGVKNYWENILVGQCGIAEIDRPDADTLLVKRAAQVLDFDPAACLTSRLRADLDRFMQLAFISAEEALADSGLQPAGSRVGIVMGTALAGMALAGETQAQFVAGKKVGPRFTSQYMGNIAAAQLSIKYGIQGPSMTVGTACSSGGDAVYLAKLLLDSGAADAMIVMAGESAVSPLLINSLVKAGALSKTGSSLPFDANRDGFVIGEGGGALILETESYAKARGAKIHAELIACGNNTDAYNVVSPDPAGTGAADCMRLALAAAGLQPEDIGYVNAHGTATKTGDIAETSALKSVFGDYAVPVSSTKGATGHMMGAGGITELIACICAIESGKLPPNTGLTTQDENCALNLVKPGQTADLRYAMSNALGFGGQNSSVIVGKYA